MLKNHKTKVFVITAVCAVQGRRRSLHRSLELMQLRRVSSPTGDVTVRCKLHVLRRTVLVEIVFVLSPRGDCQLHCARWKRDSSTY